MGSCLGSRHARPTASGESVVVYRKLGNYMLEDNCSEGIWMKALEAEATGKPASPNN